MLDKLKSIFIAVVFVSGLIGAIIFHKTEPRATIICIGSVFFIFGLFILFSQKLSMKSLPILIFPAVGALMIIIPALMLYAENSDDLDSEVIDSLAINCFMCIFTLVGIGLIAVPPILHNIKMKMYTMPIDAVCIDLDWRISRSKHGRGTMLYAPTWEYSYNGNTYTYKESTYTNLNVPKVGAVYQLLMNPDEPEELYRPSKPVRLLLLFLGLGFAVMGAIALIVYNTQF